MLIIYLAVGKEIMRFKKAKKKILSKSKICYDVRKKMKSGSLLKKMTKTWKIAI